MALDWEGENKRCRKVEKPSRSSTVEGKGRVVMAIS